jgi:enamine deaminase RidA (YjgF/YER057c/UK114 family)
MTAIRPNDWPAGSGYAHGMLADGRVLAIAGQIGWDPIAQRVVAGGIVDQTRQALTNVVAVLAAASAAPSRLVRLTWFITDRDAYLREQKAIGVAYRDVIGRHYPAMSVIVVAGLLEPGAVVEIEATAVVPHIPASSATSNSTGA